MGGICGQFNFLKEEPIERGTIQAMCDAMKEWGPDGEGIFVDKIIGLGHRHLATISFENGAQPIPNEDETIYLICDGEIHNFRELKEELEKRGHKFRTESDVEVILHLYEEKGVECINRLNGAFAFAIWESKEKRLLLAHDAVAGRPINYTIKDGRLIFASQIKPILGIKGIERNPDYIGIHHYLTYQYVPAPFTAFSEIKKLPSGHYLICERGDIKIKQWWDINYLEKTSLSIEKIKEKIIELITEATKLRLISDVPLGVFLSGGIDSSAVVAIMASLINTPIKTFSIDFEVKSFSEINYARKIASHFKCDHHEFTLTPQICKELIPKIVWHYEEPFADSSAIPTFYVAQKAKEHGIKVILNGDGGDESFGGYERYVAMKIFTSYQKIPTFIREGIRRIFALIPQPQTSGNIIRRIQRFTNAASSPGESLYARLICHFTNEQKNKLYSEEFKEAIKGVDSERIIIDSYARAKATNWVEKTQYVDVNNYLPDAMVVKMRVATAANSIAPRAPFLDPNVMKFAASIPPHLKVKIRNKAKATKYILREALSGLVPKEILQRGKMGFGVPISFWLRKELKEDLREAILGDSARQRPYFNLREVQRLFDEHMSGRTDHSYRLWNLFMLELWHRTFID
jgi:asparagine synthase (glutamine-hydrolysing)